MFIKWAKRGRLNRLTSGDMQTVRTPELVILAYCKWCIIFFSQIETFCIILTLLNSLFTVPKTSEYKLNHQSTDPQMLLCFNVLQFESLLLTLVHSVTEWRQHFFKSIVRYNVHYNITFSTMMNFRIFLFKETHDSVILTCSECL